MNKKPLIIFDDKYKKGRVGQESIGKQNLLLKGLMFTNGDIDKSAKLAGLRNATEAYRMLDRVMIRREYHDALAEEGIDLRWIVRGIKSQAENASLDSVRLSALRMLLMSLGLNTYNVAEEGTKSWEDTLLEATEQAEIEEANKPALVSGRYNVNIPAIPESVKAQRQEEEDLGKELYAHQ